MNKRAWRVGLSSVLAIAMLFGTIAFAFSDTAEDKDKEKILSLKERGILHGSGNAFLGAKKLTYAEGVQMIVKGLDLSLAAFLFVKEPLASDSFDHVPDDAWFAPSFVIAHVNGLGLPRDIDPKAVMTKEAFTHYLFTALTLKGDYPFTKRLFVLSDEAEVNPDYQYSIQTMLNGGIVQLNEEGAFEPKKELSRREAAVMLYDTMAFAESHAKEIPDDGIQTEEVALAVEKLNDEVNKVTLSWGEKPNSGYRIIIKEVAFLDDKTAEIRYELQYPEEGRMYAQVMTTPTAVIYTAAQYEIVPRLITD